MAPQGVGGTAQKCHAYQIEHYCIICGPWIVECTCRPSCCSPPKRVCQQRLSVLGKRNPGRMDDYKSPTKHHVIITSMRFI